MGEYEEGALPLPAVLPDDPWDLLALLGYGAFALSDEFLAVYEEGGWQLPGEGLGHYVGEHDGLARTGRGGAQEGLVLR